MKNITIKTLVMNFVQSRGTARRKDIVQFIHECKGETFNPVRDRGFLSTAFSTRTYRNLSYSGIWNNAKKVYTFTGTGYFMKPSKVEKRFLVQDKPYGPYHVETF